VDHNGNWIKNENNLDAQTKAIEERLKDNKRKMGRGSVQVEETIPTLANKQSSIAETNHDDLSALNMSDGTTQSEECEVSVFVDPTEGSPTDDNYSRE